MNRIKDTLRTFGNASNPPPKWQRKVLEKIELGERQRAARRQKIYRAIAVAAVLLIAWLFLGGCCVEPAPSRWEAATELSRVTCDESPATRGRESCYESARSGWCPNEDVCSDPIDDVALYDRCLVRVRNECWRLFHW